MQPELDPPQPEEVTEAIAEALALPAKRRTGTLKDLEHVVILMQENCSFDHYFGTMRGVRGFADPRPLTLPGGMHVVLHDRQAATVGVLVTQALKEPL